MPANRATALRLFLEEICGAAEMQIDSSLCGSCGFLFANPRFSEQEIELKYQRVYQRFVGGGAEEVPDARSRRDAARARAKAEYVRDVVMWHSPGRKKLRVMDYGGQDGVNCIPLVEAGHSGFVVDYLNRPMPTGIERLGKDLGDVKASERFDVVLIIHTLEHLVEPLRMIRKLAAHMGEDGLIYMEVPLGVWREYKEVREPMMHINFFSEQSMWHLARLAGLDVVHLETRLQYACSGRLLCVNLLARKWPRQTMTRYRTSRSQMRQWYYGTRRRAAKVKGVLLGR